MSLFDVSLGVSIVEDDENGMTMELDMNWDGNPNIVLGIKTLIGVSLPVQVRTCASFPAFNCLFLYTARLMLQN